MSIDLTTAAVSRDPFPFFIATEVVEECLAADVLKWCETFAPWSLAVTDFYEQYELDLTDAPLPSELEPLRAEPTLAALRERVGGLLGLPLAGRIEITLHRLVKGQRIRTHDDQLPDGAVARAIVQFNRGWTMAEGGLLMFFDSPESESPNRVIAPVHRSAAGFVISARSHHAVSVVHAGERFTVVYSFHV